MTLNLYETAFMFRASISRAAYLRARTQLQHEKRILVWSRVCEGCSLVVPKSMMPGPRQKVCKVCWNMYIVSNSLVSTSIVSMMWPESPRECPLPLSFSLSEKGVGRGQGCVIHIH